MAYILWPLSAILILHLKWYLLFKWLLISCINCYYIKDVKNRNWSFNISGYKWTCVAVEMKSQETDVQCGSAELQNCMWINGIKSRQSESPLFIIFPGCCEEDGDKDIPVVLWLPHIFRCVSLSVCGRRTVWREQVIIICQPSPQQTYTIEMLVHLMWNKGSQCEIHCTSKT